MGNWVKLNNIITVLNANKLKSIRVNPTKINIDVNDNVLNENIDH